LASLKKQYRKEKDKSINRMGFIKDGCSFLLRMYDEKKFFLRKKIGFDYPFDVTKCLQQIQLPILLHMCA